MTARQSVTISRDAAGRTRLGQPAAARPGPVARGPVIAVVRGDRVDPVALLGAEADQAGPVPQQRAELPHWLRGDPCFWEQVRAEQLRQDRRAGPCRSSAAPRRSPCTATGAPGAGRTRNPPAAPPASWCRSRPRTRPVLPAASRRSPFKIGSVPLGTFRLASTSPPVSTTATWDRLRCTSIPT